MAGFYCTLYVRTELSHNNESYVVPDLKGVTLQQHYDAIKAMVKQKTGRAMQEKKVTVIGKNGKPKERNGSSPIRESVVNIKPDTTMADLQKYTLIPQNFLLAVSKSCNMCKLSRGTNTCVPFSAICQTRSTCSDMLLARSSTDFL